MSQKATTLKSFVEEFDILGEAVFDADQYTWYRWRKVAPVTITRRGKTTEIERGAAFGLRPATSAEGKYRLIFKHEPTKVYSIDRALARRLERDAELKESKLTEASGYHQHLFAKVDELSIDPDRSDVYDVVHDLVPSLVRMAYTFLYHDKVQHDRRKSDEDDEFEFTHDALRSEVESVIEQVRKRLEDLSLGKDLNGVIEGLKGEFKHPLVEPGAREPEVEPEPEAPKVEPKGEPTL